MKEIIHDMKDGGLITPYHLICLLRKYISNQDNVDRSLFEQVILDVRDVRQSLRNKLDERDTKNIRRNLL
jgi:hypothetical protein